MEISNPHQRPSFSVYDASAGSGKTYTLVKEYLKIILSAKKNDAYRNILAITFTNKAVHEMKSRILQSLYEFSREKSSSKATQMLDDIADDMKLPIANIKSKAMEIVKHLIYNYASFDILTIDKFTHKVIRAFAYDLNLPSTFEVTLDTDLLLSEAVDAIIAQAGEDETITNLLLDFTIEKADDDKSWDVSREIFEIGKLIYSENNREQISLLQNNTIPEFVEVRKKIRHSKTLLESQNKSLGAKAIALIDQNSIDIRSFSRGTLPNHLVSIRDGKYKVGTKKFHQIEEVQINKTAKDSEVIKSIIPEIISVLEEVYANFDKVDFYSAILKNITPLSLLNTISNTLDRIQKEQNLISIAEFNTLIFNEIQNQPAPFIYEKLGEKYFHFFIDEFQDTSIMQWKNIIPLIDNALSSEFQQGEKGTLMIVGDPKQSIYRWRGGKAEQFIAIANNENPFHNSDKKVFRLQTNYRSYSEIIDFNNKFFKFISAEFADPDYRDLYQNHSYQLGTNLEGGYVGITFLNSKIDDDLNFEIEEENNKNDLYCKLTLQKIHEIVDSGYEYRDVAILTRKRSQGIQLAGYLSKRNIPLVSSETLLIENSTEVRCVIDVLKYVRNQNDNEAKAFFLLYIATNNLIEIAVNDFVSTGVKLKEESDFEAWLLKFDISIKFENLRKKPLYEVVEQIITILIKSKKSNSYLQFFLDVVLERDYYKQTGISDFLVFWESNSSKYSIPSPEGSNAVKILTVHKSKGLEFPIVILPFADEDYDKKPKDKIWLETNLQDFGLPKVLVDNTKAVENFGEEGLEAYSRQKQEELLDNVNVLYVALTRAEEQLHIISSLVGPRKDGKYPNSMASFFVKYLKGKNIFEENKLKYEFGTLERRPAQKSIERNENEIIEVSSKLNFSKIKIAKKEALLWGTFQQEAIEYGNIIHEILSKIKLKNDVDQAIAIAVESGLINLNQKVDVNDVITEILNNEELVDYFCEEYEVLNEKIIIQNDAATIKPDRIVVTPNNEVFLLDYKTGVYKSSHKVQLENYQNVLEKMGFKVVLKTLVYIGKKIELIKLSNS